jgi:hypothetical protein
VPTRVIAERDLLEPPPCVPITTDATCVANSVQERDVDSGLLLPTFILELVDNSMLQDCMTKFKIIE